MAIADCQQVAPPLETKAPGRQAACIRVAPRAGRRMTDAGARAQADHQALRRRMPPSIASTSSVPRNSVVALVGESGSGKTTTGLLALRLIAATSGQILLDGEDITHLEPEAAEALSPADAGGVPGQLRLARSDDDAGRDRRRAARHPRHRHAPPSAATRRAPGSKRSGSMAATPTATRTNCRAASGSASRWRAR